MTSVILQAAAGPLFLLQLLLSLFFLVRGHHLPGGGFIGGLLASSAFILIALARDPQHARKALRLSPQTYIAIGLSVATLSGLISLFAGAEYMTGLWVGELSLPGLGKIGLGTPFLFDVGVYFVVFGVTTLVVFTLFEGMREDL